MQGAEEWPATRICSCTVLFNVYINDLPVTTCMKFIYADDICLAHQARTFEDLKTTINADIANISEYCKRWRLQPSVAKTMSSTFHLHNARINQELDVILNGKRLRHDKGPTNVGVTLDCTLTNPIFGKQLQKPGQFDSHASWHNLGSRCKNSSNISHDPRSATLWLSTVLQFGGILHTPISSTYN